MSRYNTGVNAEALVPLNKLFKKERRSFPSYFMLSYSGVTSEAQSEAPRGPSNLLSDRTRAAACARESPRPGAAAGRGGTGEEGESEAAALPAERHAQVCASPEGKTDVGASFPEPAAFPVTPAH